MFDIPSPPPLQWGAGEYALGIGAIVVGMALLWQGRNLGRAVVAIAGAAAGWALGGVLSGMLTFQIDPAIVRLVAAFTFMLIGLIAARLAWAILAGVIFALAAALIAWCRVFPLLTDDLRPVFAATDAAMGAYANGLAQYAVEALAVLLDKHPTLTWAIGVAGGGPMLIVLLWRRGGTIFMTSLVGAAGVVSGAALCLLKLRPTLWPPAREHYYIVASVAAVLGIAGVCFQYRRAIAGDRKKECEQAETSDKSKTKTDDRADKEK